MTDVILPNKEITGPNLFTQVQGNDQAIVDTVNGDLDDGNIANGADIDGSKIRDASLTNAKYAADSVTPDKLNLTYASDAGSSSSLVFVASGAGPSVIAGLSSGTLEAGTYLVLAHIDIFFDNACGGVLSLLGNFTTLDTATVRSFDASNDLRVRVSLSAITSPVTATTYQVTLECNNGFGIGYYGTTSVIRAVKLG